MKYIKAEMTLELRVLVDDSMDASQLDCLIEDPSMIMDFHMKDHIAPMVVLDGKVLEEKKVSDESYFDYDKLTEES